MKLYAATIGCFDGVHCGHRFLLGQLREAAASASLLSAVITFEEHPQTILMGESPRLLSSFDERVELLKEQQLDEIFAFRFEVIREMTAAEFLRVLHDQCGIRLLVMGYDHQFGSDGKKSKEEYQRLGEEAGIELKWIPQAPEGAISSSRIRKALLSGEMEAAEQMLGYAYSLEGTVTRGKELGRQIGFPTANLQVTDTKKLIPANGVYAADVLWNNRQYAAVVNIGNNPTVGGEQMTIEAHLLDFAEDLYGQKIRIRFRQFLRGEIRFDSIAQLQKQIQQDIQKATR